MSYPNIKNTADWDAEWSYSHNTVIIKGAIFILNCYGDSSEMNVYRAEQDWHPSMGPKVSIALSMFRLIGATVQRIEWSNHHAWALGNRASKIKFWLRANGSRIADPIKPQSVVRDMNDWRAWAHNVPGECPCGIPRGRCDYH